MGPNVADELEAFIRRDLLKDLGSASTELADKPLRELFTIHGNLMARLIPPRPRRVWRSKELNQQLGGGQYVPAIESIEEKIRTGADLKPHLSARVEHKYPLNAKEQRQQLHIDHLQSEWGVHHLHLSIEPGKDGFLARTNDLLFASFTPTDGFLIGLFPHRHWADSQVVRTIVQNWPDAGLVWASNYAIGLAHQFSDEDRLKMQQAGISTSIELDGRVYIPFGQTLSGMPVQASRHGMGVDAALGALREAIATDPKYLDMRLEELGHRPDPRQKWQPFVRDYWYGLRWGRRGNVFIPIAPQFPD